MLNRSDIAAEKFLSGFNCAQSILFAFRDLGDLSEEVALKIACGLGAGMGRKEEVCGAVSGGILALGMRFGRGPNDDSSATDLTYQKTRELMVHFSSKHGSCICRKLLNGCELTTEEGQRMFKENELKTKTCVPCIRTVAEILEQLLLE